MTEPKDVWSYKINYRGDDVNVTLKEYLKSRGSLTKQLHFTGDDDKPFAIPSIPGMPDVSLIKSTIYKHKDFRTEYAVSIDNRRTNPKYSTTTAESFNSDPLSTATTPNNCVCCKHKFSELLEIDEIERCKKKHSKGVKKSHCKDCCSTIADARDIVDDTLYAILELVRVEAKKKGAAFCSFCFHRKKESKFYYHSNSSNGRVFVPVCRSCRSGRDYFCVEFSHKAETIHLYKIGRPPPRDHSCYDNLSSSVTQPAECHLPYPSPTELKEHDDLDRALRLRPRKKYIAERAEAKLKASRDAAFADDDDFVKRPVKRPSRANNSSSSDESDDEPPPKKRRGGRPRYPEDGVVDATLHRGPWKFHDNKPDYEKPPLHDPKYPFGSKCHGPRKATREPCPHPQALDSFLDNAMSRQDIFEFRGYTYDHHNQFAKQEEMISTGTKSLNSVYPIWLRRTHKVFYTNLRCHMCDAVVTQECHDRLGTGQHNFIALCRQREQIERNDDSML